MIEFDLDEWNELLCDVTLYIIKIRTRGAHFGYWMGLRVAHFWSESIYDDAYLSEFLTNYDIKNI